MAQFELVSENRPLGDQPAAIDALAQSIESGRRYQTLLGVTGSGKTFTMANVIARLNRPTLIISHNKTLAAQLYEEFKELFPNNAVCYFVSYYDYYQPEAYIPQRDIYIEKDSSRNDDLDRLRLFATTNIISRRDVIVVASVSCIFGLGSPDTYKKSVISLAVGQRIARRDLLIALNDLQYARSDIELSRGKYRVRGDVVEVHPAGEEYAIRVEMFGDDVESLAMIHPLTGEVLSSDRHVFIYPAIHYVVPQDTVQRAVDSIKAELDHRVLQLKGEGKLLEAQRLLARTRYDLELLAEVGFCSGVENYSRHLDGRPPGAKPFTLLDYFRYGPPPPPEAGNDADDDRTSDAPSATPGVAPLADIDSPDRGHDRPDQWLLMIDESHVTIPQLHAMFNGDRNRKQVLVDHGFRLPSALDNRPLRFEEIEAVWPQVVFVSATPGRYELERTASCGARPVEQIIRPTGLIDPEIVVRPAASQVPDVMRMAKERAQRGERTLVTTLTKRLAEHLASYLAEQGLRTRYLHSEIQTLDRVTILRELREGKYDVLVGVNLLREGLDLPEVSLVGILDADKTGFLRSATSLIQQIGRAARNEKATVVLYADQVTPAMKQAIDETQRRRVRQLSFNAEHGITPRTVRKEIRRGIELELRARELVRRALRVEDPKELDKEELLSELEKAMMEAADALEFEKAAMIRDRLKRVRAMPDIGKVKVDDSGLPMVGDDEDGSGEAASPPPGSPGTRARRGRTRRGSGGR